MAKLDGNFAVNRGEKLNLQAFVCLRHKREQRDSLLPRVCSGIDLQVQPGQKMLLFIVVYLDKWTWSKVYVSPLIFNTFVH